MDTRPDWKQGTAQAAAQRGVYARLFSEYAEDEKLVEAYWTNLDCSVSRLDSEDRRQPDFLIKFPNGSRAVCEVKSFGGPETGASDYDLDYRLDLRISNALYSGISQLTDYKESEDLFRILFFVNHNDTIKFDSLVRHLDGEWDPIKKKFCSSPTECSSEARSRRRIIDLYMWLRDTPKSSSEQPSQHWGRLERAGELCNVMNLNPVQLRLIQAA